MHVAELTPLNDARVRAEQVSRPAGRTPAGRRAELGNTALPDYTKGTAAWHESGC